MSWNRDYRPRQIAELHNTAVREYFLSLMKAGNLPQVFLFTGSKGTGKTSTARILAALVNDPENESAVRKIFFTKEKNTSPLKEPSLQNELTARIFSGSSFAVTELDAASNRGIDDVRSLKERISLPPQEGSMAVYILDEVHMLTTEAFNALLKILEEPPAHVIFILATTEYEKIPPTIASRAQVIRFTQATSFEIEAALQTIIAKEKLTAEPEAISLIATHSDGSFRDAVKLLEMVAQIGPVTVEATRQLLVGSLHNYIASLIEKLLAKDEKEIVVLFKKMQAEQVNPKLLHTQLLSYLHTDLMRSIGALSGEASIPTKTSLFLLKEFSDAAVSVPCPLPLLPLEIKFLDLIERSHKKNSPPEPPSSNSGSSLKKTAPMKPVTDTGAVVQKDSPPSKATTVQADVDATTVHETMAPPIAHETSHGNAFTEEKMSSDSTKLGDGQAVFSQWATLVSQAASQNFGLATLLKAAQPISGEAGSVTIKVFYKFHQEQLQQPKFRKMIDALFSTIAGGPVQLQCTLAEPGSAAELTDVANQDNLAQLATASLM